MKKELLTKIIGYIALAFIGLLIVMAIINR